MYYVDPTLSPTCQVPDEVSCEVLVLGSDKREGGALLPRPACTSDAMDVRVNVPGHVKIHHRLDGRNVQASSCRGGQEVR